MILDILLR